MISVDVYSPQMVGIIDLTSPNVFSIYPNPTANRFTLKNIATKGNVEVINVFGEVVYSEKWLGKNECVVDAAFAKGIYFVQVNGVVKKLIVE